MYRIQANDSIIWGYFCIGFIEFMLKDKNFFDYTTSFCPNKCEKNDKIMLKYFE